MSKSAMKVAPQSVVLHSSAVLEWIYVERTTETLAQAMETVITRGAWVPAHWRLEVASVLEHNTRHRRHDHIFRNETLRDLSLLAIQVDAETHGRAWEMTLEIAVRRNVSVYDAAYVELALRRGLPLVAVEAAVRRAAQAEDVVVLG